MLRMRLRPGERIPSVALDWASNQVIHSCTSCLLTACEQERPDWRQRRANIQMGRTYRCVHFVRDKWLGRRWLCIGVGYRRAELGFVDPVGVAHSPEVEVLSVWLFLDLEQAEFFQLAACPGPCVV
jgi:hypothetical protein